MSETITLPRSGAKLERLRGADAVVGSWSGFDIMAGLVRVAWTASVWHKETKCGFRVGGVPSLERALELVDERLMGLRAAMLPPGAFIVRDDEGTRERVERALGSCVQGHTRKHIVEAVLAALREAPDA